MDAVDAVVGDLPDYEDAVVEIFVAHRNRVGNESIKRYVEVQK